MSDDEEAAAGAAAGADGAEAGVLLPEELESVLVFESVDGFALLPFVPELVLSLEDLGLALP